MTATTDTWCTGAIRQEQYWHYRSNCLALASQLADLAKHFSDRSFAYYTAGSVIFWHRPRCNSPRLNSLSWFLAGADLLLTTNK